MRVATLPIGDEEGAWMGWSIEAGRVSCVIFCGSVAIASAACLAPSFDGLQSSRSDDAVSAKDGGAGETGDAGSTSNSSGGDGTAKPPKTGSGGGTIACGAQTCSRDDAGVPQFCCTTVGGNNCQGPGTDGFCTTVEGGEIFRCDDNDDCGSAETCCYVAAAKTASCGVGCGNGGKMLCDPARPACPNGQTCSGTLNGGHRYCQ
jgi:hypothetical protein